MSYYRDVYLKSDDWKSLRALALSHGGYACFACGKEEGLDVHHLKYKKLYDVKLRHLRVLCRPCHDKVHEIMKKYPKLKTLPTGLQWKTLAHHLRKRGVETLRRCQVVNPMALQFHFGYCRQVLRTLKMVRRREMPWDERLIGRIPLNANPIIFLERYCQITGREPRRGFLRPMNRQRYAAMLPLKCESTSV